VLKYRAVGWAIDDTLTRVRDAMNRVAWFCRRRGWFGLVFFLPVVGISQTANAQLAGRFQTAPGTTAAYQYQHGSIQTVPLPADILVTFSGTGSNSTLTATIRQPIIGDMAGTFDYPNVNEFPMDVSGTSTDGQRFHGNLLDTQYLFDWTFEAAGPGQLNWNGRVYWAGGRYELTTITDAHLTAVTPGDFNADGVVDAADYILWRKTDGTPTSYENWRAHVGVSAGAGSGAVPGSGAQAAVPESATSVLVLIAAAGWLGRRGRAAPMLMTRAFFKLI
jgi:hypothetical protein